MTQDPFALPEGYGGVDRRAAAQPAALMPDEQVASQSSRYGAGVAERLSALEAEIAAGNGAGERGPGPEVVPEPQPKRRRLRWLGWLAALFVSLLLLLLGWLLLFVPVGQTAQPIVPPMMTLTASDGTPIARRGAIVDRPVRVADLPPHVVDAFLAIEDRRFRRHWGVDPKGLARAMVANLTSGAARQGGSTITQQLAKNSYLTNDRTVARKLKELAIAFWLEIWLSKDQILERYLSNAYFGDNSYGLRAASLHYYYRQPERLTLAQAATLAGLVKAPSRLAPTRNPRAATERQRLVLGAMVETGAIDAAMARATPSAEVDNRPGEALPRGGYFADWVEPAARAKAGEGYERPHVRTTLDLRLQRAAERAVAGRVPSGAEVALVAMRPDGSVVAMVGGRDHAKTSFNRAVQARRQPGSTFKLIVYLAALRSGMRPDSLVDDSPIEQGDYRPGNSRGRYAGEITLRQAFARSSNVVAVKLYSQLGHDRIAAAARDLGLGGELPRNASVALGTADASLLELTAAYAAVAGEEAPVRPHGLPQGERGFFERLFDGRGKLSNRERRDLRALLAATVREGSGSNAQLAIPAFGKTGTTQDSRDALFVGFAGELVVGVWIGRDDNRPIDGISGSGAPARIWRDFMAAAIPGAAPRPSRKPAKPPVEDLPGLPAAVRVDEDGVTLDTGLGELRMDRDGLVVDPDADAIRAAAEAEARRQMDRLVGSQQGGEEPPPPR